jgi:UDP-N-acetylmuramoylalanine--D-glutamate ligase
MLGMARSGLAAAAALESRGVEVVRVDRKLGNDLELGLLDGVGLLVKTPGVPGEHPLVREARARRIPVWSEIELGARLLENPLIGVTGTNGKTTTSEWIGAMLGAPVVGNVGRPLTGLAPESPDSWVVCEISTFQLEDVETLRPAIAVLVNLEPDHLDRHGTFEAYRAAKLRIFENQLEDDVAVVPRGFGPAPGRARRVEFDASDPLPAEPGIPGAHNRENAAAATAAARAAGIGVEAIAKALRDFAGVPHRLELVAELGGVRYVNDSKATNVGAALRALASYAEPIRLIAGGQGKGERYEPLAEAAQGKVARAYLIGEAADALAAAFEAAGVPCERCGSLERALGAAASAARPGEVVLLSPACASYDQYHDFEERGDAFRALVEGLKAATPR